MRITGLSGLDVDSMVKEMMKPYNIKVDKQKQQRDLIGWKQDVYRDVTKNMKGLYNKYLDVLSKDYILSPSKLSSAKATSTDPSIVDVSALSGAKSGTYSVTVNNLATTAQVGSTDIKSTGLDTKVSADSELTFTIGGKGYKVTPGTDLTVGSLVKNINSSLKDLGVKASYSEFSGKVTIETTKTGGSVNLDVTGLQSVKLGGGKELFGAITPGKNAEYRIKLPDGIEYPEGGGTFKSETNAFTKDNMTFTLNSKGTTTFTVKNDVSGTVDTITNFVDDYNKLVDDMYSKTTTPRNKLGEYLPLSEDQKKDMSEEQIKSWEEKGKKGLLKGDMLLNSISGDMRGVFDSYTGMGKELKKIGISLSADMSKPNHIQIDKDKLKTSLENDGENVINMLISTEKVNAKNPDGTDKKDSVGNLIKVSKGAFAKIKDITYETCMVYKSKLVEKAGASDSTSVSDELSKDIAKRNDKIKQMLKDLQKREQGFYTKFSALEQAMNKLNAQQQQFAKQFGGA